MKKYIFLCLIVLIGANYAEAQKLKPWKKPQDKYQLHLDSVFALPDIDSSEIPSHKSIQYGFYRLKISEPPYGLTKVKNLIQTHSLLSMEDKPIDAHTITARQKMYCQLSLREKFTYNMIHPEQYRQICSAMPIVLNEEKKIFAQLPAAFGEYGWNEAQSNFFTSNRDSVIVYLKDCITKGPRIGINLKHVIVNINAKEIIPLIVSTYNIEKKDYDLLTVLMLLLKNNSCKPFLASSLYKTLYADENASYKSYLDLRLENEVLIVKLANDFYNGLGK